MSQVFQALVPLLVPSVAALAGAPQAQATNLALTDAQAIADTLNAAVRGNSSTATRRPSQIAGDAVSGAVDTLAKALLGRRLLQDDSAGSGPGGRHLLQSTVRHPLLAFFRLASAA